MRLALLLISFVLLLSGCSGLTSQTTAPINQRSWHDHYQALLTTDEWQLKGKIGIRTEEQNNSANLFWEQQQQHYLIELTGPLGQGGARIEGNGDGISIDIAGEEPLWAATPEQLMQQTLGWQFPVRELLYWVRGIPAPNSPYDLSLNQQLAQQLNQNDWQINYLRYNYQSNYPLPEKITIRRNGLQLTIIAKEWQIAY
ncbi:lipoprotein insertase outer membrane protein LolB [Amphritea sp. 1_MG-2023]|uniref:lipoprotein insertase outer membrane protein LolB n=1 Tax=Amphritea sp. 1_MG-2023 TaxID=3062670 RepID=UPI0026E19D10|nr:lipoprotein insertase outer membrane protein LolB [Amphritea sp. 1_MG-2023]MDO6564879.1 lipoprotein insertase outer membrane protein LolB [Amphritea sp. 1_MG-2023]